MNIHQAVALLGITDRVEDVEEVDTPGGPYGFARMGATQVVVTPFTGDPVIDSRAFRATVHTHDDVNDAIECQASAVRMIRTEVAEFLREQVYGDGSVARSQSGFGFNL